MSNTHKILFDDTSTKKSTERIWVLEGEGGSNEPIGMFEFLNAPPGKIMMKAASKTFPYDDTIKSYLDNAQLSTKTFDEVKKFWNDLLEILQKQNYRILPAGDTLTFTMQIDLDDGTILGEGQSENTKGSFPHWIMNQMASNVRTAMNKPLKDIEHHIEQIIEKRDYTEAARQAVATFQKETPFPVKSPSLVSLLAKIPDGELQEPLREEYLLLRCGLAAEAGKYSIAGSDAQYLLKNYNIPLGKKMISLKMLVALKQQEKGHIETPLSAYKRLLEEPHSTDDIKARVYRQMARLCQSTPQEAATYYKQSANLFLSAGNKKEAARSQFFATKSLLSSSPKEALSLFDETFKWFQENDIGSRAVKGNLYRLRALELLQMGRDTEAYEDNCKGIELLKGIFGEETQLKNAYFLAMSVGSRLKKDTKKYEQEFKATFSGKDPNEDIRMKIISALKQHDDDKHIELKKQIELEGDPALMNHFRAISAIQNTDLSLDQKLEELETILIAAQNEDNEELQCVALTGMGQVLAKHERFDRALETYKKLHQLTPTDSSARTNIANTLMTLKKYPELITFLEIEIEIWGETPAWNCFLAVALLRNHNYSKAATLFSKVIISKNVSEVTKQVASEGRDEAIAKEGEILPFERAQSSRVLRQDLEESLAMFVDYIGKNRRRDFWQGENGKHIWISKPESIAQGLLHTWLHGVFGETLMESTEELYTGGGRIDIYLRFTGGLRAIIELKMAGNRYTTKYAFKGTKQLNHYMNNEDCHLGYLVVFDARKTIFGTMPKICSDPSNTISILFADVRDTIS